MTPSKATKARATTDRALLLEDLLANVRSWFGHARCFEACKCERCGIIRLIAAIDEAKS